MGFHKRVCSGRLSVTHHRDQLEFSLIYVLKTKLFADFGTLFLVRHDLPYCCQRTTSPRRDCNTTSLGSTRLANRPKWKDIYVIELEKVAEDA